MTDNRIKQIVIVGGGTAGWMTAAALSKILGPDYAKIQLIESDSIGTVGVGEATIPQIATFNRMLGIPEDEFIKHTNASFKLGIEFVNWKKLDHSYFHPFGHYGVDMEGLSFHAYWQRLYQEGLVEDPSEFSLMAMAAKNNKFMRPFNAGKNSPLNEIAYAFHFDSTAYAKMLRQHAENRGVIRTEGKVVDVQQRSNDGFIESVQLESGEKITGELFIDCSGFRGLLIQQTLKAGFEDWSDLLLCNSAVVAPCEGVSEISSFTRTTAHKAGWQWRIPLQHRIGNGHVYCSDYTSDDEATATLLDHLDGEPLAEPRILRFTTGHSKKFWDKNCIAIGLSSGFMEPLESTSIWLIQSGISRLLTNFPDKTFAQADANRYNRVLIEEFELIRDFLILHYHANERTDSEFWIRCREMTVPDRLQEKLEVFHNNGRTFREHDELFNDTSWFAVMNGQCAKPRTYDPVADLLSLEETKDRLQKIRIAIANSADYMPKHRDFINKNCDARTLKL